MKAFRDESSSVERNEKVPEWVPELARPPINFLNAQDVTLEQVIAPVTKSGLYKNYLKDYVESPLLKNSFGWNRIPELVNGRAAMVGFVAAVIPELFDAGTVIEQLAAAPQTVVLFIALIYAATVIPIVKGADGDYLDSLKDTYTMPEGWFTEANERVNGRAAMAGMGLMIAFELITGHALF